jgi:hypothetical protein
MWPDFQIDFLKSRHPAPVERLLLFREELCSVLVFGVLAFVFWVIGCIVTLLPRDPGLLLNWRPNIRC